MIQHKTLNTIRREQRKDDFLFPFYRRYSIAEVVPTILHNFGVDMGRNVLPFAEFKDKTWKKIVLLVADGFGYNHFVKHYQGVPFFKSLAIRGNVYPLTSVFPSTTAAALTTLHTGFTPQEHALPEWTVYFEEFDSIIETLPFKTWEMPERDSLLQIGGKSEMLYEGPTAYEALQQHGVPSYMHIYQDYARTAYSDTVHKGSTKVPYSDGRHMLSNVMDTLHSNGPLYCFVYWGHIDSTAHQFGSGTPQHTSAITNLGELIQTEFIAKLTPDIAKDTLFLMTADHGHANIRQEDIINLNKYDIIEQNFLVSSKGRRILPTGSPHDVFLFIDPDKVSEVVSFLQDELVGKAEVLLTEEAVKRGLFGVGKPTEKFLKRIGNVLILPYRGYHIWYQFLPNMTFTQLGIHGGLSEDEMIVPFGISELSQLAS